MYSTCTACVIICCHVRNRCTFVLYGVACILSGHGSIVKTMLVLFCFIRWGVLPTTYSNPGKGTFTTLLVLRLCYSAVTANTRHVRSAPFL